MHGSGLEQRGMHLANAINVSEQTRLAEVAQGALRTATVVDRRRESASHEQVVDGGDGVAHTLSQPIVDNQFPAPVVGYMEDGTMLYRALEHFFQAHGLRGELEVVVESLLLRPVLVLDRVESPVRPKLDDIAFADQAKGLAPDRQRVLDAGAVPPGQVRHPVHSFVLGITAGSVQVLLKLAFQLD